MTIPNGEQDKAERSGPQTPAGSARSAPELATLDHKEILNDLRSKVLANDDEALMRLSAHLQACSECLPKLFPLVEQLSAAAASDDEPGTIARAESLQAGPGMREHEPGMVERGTNVYGGGREAAIEAQHPPAASPNGISCVRARSAFLDYLQTGGQLPKAVLEHLRTCPQCGAHFTDAALTRYTREVHGEEELPAID